MFNQPSVYEVLYLSRLPSHLIMYSCFYLYHNWFCLCVFLTQQSCHPVCPSSSLFIATVSIALLACIQSISSCLISNPAVLLCYSTMSGPRRNRVREGEQQRHGGRLSLVSCFIFTEENSFVPVDEAFCRGSKKRYFFTVATIYTHCSLETFTYSFFFTVYNCWPSLYSQIT